MRCYDICKVLAEKLGRALPAFAPAAAAAEAAAAEAAAAAAAAAGGSTAAAAGADPLATAACTAVGEACGAGGARGWVRLATLEFNRDRKSMGVLVRTAPGHGGGGGAPRNKLCVKGAPDMLLKRCAKVCPADPFPLPSGRNCSFRHRLSGPC